MLLWVKQIQNFCGQLWLFKIFMKMRCYQNKMYDTPRALMWWMWSLNISKCSPHVWQLRWPFLLKHASVDTFHIGPMCTDVVVLLYTSITAAKKEREKKIPVKPNHGRWIYYCAMSKYGVEWACHSFRHYCQQRTFTYSIMMRRCMEKKKLLLLKLTPWDRESLYVKASVRAKCYNCLFVSVGFDGGVSLLFPGSVCEGMIHVDSTADCADDYPK